MLTMQAFPGDGKNPEPIPDEFADEVETARMEIVEAAAEGDDALLEKYLEGEDLSAEEIQKGLLSVIHSGAFVPLFVAAGGAEIGLAPLLEALIALMTSPTHVQFM